MHGVIVLSRPAAPLSFFDSTSSFSLLRFWRVKPYITLSALNENPSVLSRVQVPPLHAFGVLRSSLSVIPSQPNPSLSGIVGTSSGDPPFLVVTLTRPVGGTFSDLPPPCFRTDSEHFEAYSSSPFPSDYAQPLLLALRYSAKAGLSFLFHARLRGNPGHRNSLSFNSTFWRFSSLFVPLLSLTPLSRRGLTVCARSVRFLPP